MHGQGVGKWLDGLAAVAVAVRQNHKREEKRFRAEFPTSPRARDHVRGYGLCPFPVLRLRPTHSREGNMFIAISTSLAIVAFGGWWFYLSEAAVARKREEKQRELERPDHDHEHALEIAKRESELSRLKGWTGTGA